MTKYNIRYARTRGSNEKSFRAEVIQPKSVVRACADFVYCWAYCLPYSWRRSGLRQENKTGKMPTSKRKMNRKRWKQPKIIGKRSNDRLGFNAVSTNWKPLVNARLLLHFHERLFPLPVSGVPHNRSRWSLQADMFSAPLPTRACLLYIFVQFLVRNLTLWLPFSSPIANLAAKNRFSRRFVLMQNRGGVCMRQNEFLFERAAICTSFGAICSKIQCVLVQNSVCFDAKCLAFWC